MTASPYIHLTLCTNDDHGEQSGFVTAIHLDDALELECHLIPSNTRIRFEKGRMKISRRWFPILGSRGWVGNIFWTGVAVSPQVAADIFNYVKGLRYWDSVGGWVEISDKWDAGTLCGDDLKEVIRA